MFKMSIITSVLFVLLIVNSGVSQNKIKPSQRVRVLGISGSGSPYGYLEGNFGPHVVFGDPGISPMVPNTFPYRKQVPYKALLVSGLQSMLNEHRNYQGKVTSVSYLVFALGNYNKMNAEILSFINKNILSNQSLLLTLYDWAKPHYKKIFNELTVEEQTVLLQKVALAEKYTQFVLIQNNQKLYEDWLVASGITPDEKLNGFLARRVSKKQWTAQTCLSWVNRIKKDFSKIKDTHIPANHFIVLNVLHPSLILTCDAKGSFFLTDSSFKVLYGPYACLMPDGNKRLRIYNNLTEKGTLCYLNDNAKLEFPPDLSWFEWYPWKDSTIYFEKWDARAFEILKGVYSSVTSASVCSKFLVDFDGTNFFFLADSSDYRLYNTKAKLITTELIDLRYSELFDESGNTHTLADFPALVHDRKWILMRNTHQKYGLSTTDGKSILPFLFDEMFFSREKGAEEVSVRKNGEEYKVFKIQNDELIPAQ